MSPEDHGVVLAFRDKVEDLIYFAHEDRDTGLSIPSGKSLDGSPKVRAQYEEVVADYRSKLESFAEERAKLIEVLKALVTRGDVLVRMEARDAAIKLLSQYKYPKAVVKP